ncbi:MAG: protein kinase [Candidatus Competibacter sp.]|nr:protein kinase [Candidatus Competibacter sp.]MDS4059225.1 protein kinase [Candidatus Contendobacter sp.]
MIPSQNPEIPGYTIERLLGAGAMARVYLAVQNSLNRQVALKVMNSGDPQFHERFLREGRIVARLKHHHIVPVYDVGEFQGCYYMVMEYAEGGTLEARIQQGLTIEQTLTILHQVAMALDYAHQQGLVHRDIKPANILFMVNGDAKVADFGIAKDYRQDQQLTQIGWMVGTPSYMSPEQVLAQTVDSRSDLYSLGVMFYEMLTGGKPYKARDPNTLRTMHVQQPIPRLSGALARYQGVIDRLMAKKPEQRFATAAELLAELSRLGEGSGNRTRREVEMSDGEWQVRVEADAKRGAGHAVLVIEGLALPPDTVCCIKRGDDDLGPDGWHNGEYWLEPLLVETTSAWGSRVVLGPGIVRYMENGNYRLGLQAPNWDKPQERGLNWRDIPPPPQGPSRRRGQVAVDSPKSPPPPVPEPEPPPPPPPQISEPEPPIPKPDERDQRKRSPSAVLMLLALGILAVLGVGGYWWWSSQPHQPVPPAQPVVVPSPPNVQVKPTFTVQDARNRLQEGLTPDQMYALAQQFQAQPEGLQGAFLLYEHAAEQNHAGAALKLAAMYDPTRSEPTPLPRRRAVKAYEWYRKAAASGVAEANQRLDTLHAWAEREAARGDADAQALLQEWQ